MAKPPQGTSAQSAQARRRPRSSRQAVPPSGLDGHLGRHETSREKVAWVSLHALRVPRADRDVQPHVAPRHRQSASAPLTYDQFDIVKVFVMRACTLVALAGVGLALFMRGGRVRRTQGRLADPRVPRVGALLTTFTSIHPPTALFGKYRRFEGLLSFVNYAVVFFLDRPARRPPVAHPVARCGRCSSRTISWPLRRAAVPRARPDQVGQAALRGEPPLLDLRQPRPARRLPHVLAAHLRSRSRSPRSGVAVAYHVLDRLRSSPRAWCTAWPSAARGSAATCRCHRARSRSRLGTRSSSSRWTGVWSRRPPRSPRRRSSSQASRSPERGHERRASGSSRSSSSTRAAR